MSENKNSSKETEIKYISLDPWEYEGVDVFVTKPPKGKTPKSASKSLQKQFFKVRLSIVRFRFSRAGSYACKY